MKADVPEVVLTEIRRPALDLGSPALDLGKLALDPGNLALDLGNLALDLGKLALDLGKLALDPESPAAGKALSEMAPGKSAAVVQYNIPACYTNSFKSLI